MNKRVLILVLVLVVMGLSLPNDNSVEALQTQSIRLPFAPRYTYNPSTNSFAQQVYGISNACENTQRHTGNAYYAVDFGNSFVDGTPIYAPVSGTIISAQWEGIGYGLTLKLKEDNVDRIHWLAHLSKFIVTSGHVNQGELVALSGHTGGTASDPMDEHLHYHVTDQANNAVDVRGKLPDITWYDPSDYCLNNFGNDGTAHPSKLPNGTTAVNCPEFYNYNLPGVWGFDAPNCQGNIIFGPLYEGNYDMSAIGANDKLKSISTHGLNFWLYGHSDNDSLKHCHAKDMWNLDTDNYNGVSTKIGWDPSYNREFKGGIDSVSSGYNMVSRVVITTDPCPQTQETRVSAYTESYGVTSTPSPDWLLNLSTYEDPPSGFHINTKVDAIPGVYDAHRVLVDGNVIFETSAGEYDFTWNTSSTAAGYHTLTVQYRTLSDGGNWANADNFDQSIYITRLNHENSKSCDYDPVPLVISEEATVISGNVLINLYTLPSNSSQLLSMMYSGEPFTVLEGPLCSDEVWWWKVEYKDMIGWTQNGTPTSPWIEKLP